MDDNDTPHPLPPGDDPWPTTRVLKTLWPPQPGTLYWRTVHGARLVCVRYRYDRHGKYRYTTVEIVVDHAIRKRKRGARRRTRPGR